MSSKRGIKRRQENTKIKKQCGNKIQFITAQDAARYRSRYPKLKILGIYRCTICQYYHLGHRPKWLIKILNDRQKEKTIAQVVKLVEVKKKIWEDITLYKKNITGNRIPNSWRTIVDDIAIVITIRKGKWFLICKPYFDLQQLSCTELEDAKEEAINIMEEKLQ